MTVGEKIQFYRKKIGLSQEELGQKLLVSRQTVSLWELDRTLPSIDNLTRLKEIFSVSVDDILSDLPPHEEEEEIKAEAPRESYTFRYSESDMSEILKHFISPLIRILCISAVSFTVFLIGTGSLSAFTGIITGIFIFSIIMQIRAILSYRKIWKTSGERAISNEYLYEVYENYFVLTVSKNGEKSKTLKIYFEDVEKTHRFGNYILLEIAAQCYIIKKDELCEDSLFHSLKGKEPQNTERTSPDGRLRIIARALCSFSVTSIVGALICVALLSSKYNLTTEYMWVFFLFTPVSVSSVAFGYYLKKKGYKYKANVIVGIIMTVLLCIYGSFSFIFAGTYSHSDAPILKTEKLLSIDIPEHTHITTQDWTDGTQSVPYGYIISVSNIYFDEDKVKEFERKLPADRKWMSSIPSDMLGVTPYFFGAESYDHFIIYNVHTKDVNELPYSEGTYKFIAVMYSSGRNTMQIIEYEIEYSK